MGNSSSARGLPYSIGSGADAEIRPARYDGNHTGWSMVRGTEKSSGKAVSVFKFCKSANATASGDPRLADLRQRAAAHHFQKIKTLVHPQLLRALATLDTDDPDGSGGAASSSSSSSSMMMGSSSSSGPKPATGEYIVVTEAVVPLASYLDDLRCEIDSDAAGAGANNDRSMADTLAWGLVNVIEALQFLHSTAGLSHCRLCPDSIYVTAGGNFLLGDFCMLTALPPPDGILSGHFTAMHDGCLLPPSYCSPERTERRWDLLAQCSGPHVLDSYSLGVLIRDLYGRWCKSYLHTNGGSGSERGVPPKLVKAVQRLTTPHAKLRPRLASLLKCPVFVDNATVANLRRLEGMAAAPAEEKLSYLQSLPDALNRGILRKRVAEHKVLPELIRIVNSIVHSSESSALMQQDICRRQILACVAPLHIITVKILEDGASSSSTSTFATTVTPLLISLFSVNDRGIRGALLSRFIPVVAKHWAPESPCKGKAQIERHVFEPMCSGFSDSSAALRELTLKSSLPLVPVLTKSSTGSIEKLCRYLVRLQSDPEPGIRTNVIVFVGKVCSQLPSSSRDGLVLSAFARAMGDPFAPCRLAALRALPNCTQYFDPRGIATKVLPVLVPHTVDATPEVRHEALVAVEAFLNVLKEDHLRRETEDEGAAGTNTESSGATSSSLDVNKTTTTSNEPAASSAASSYFGGLSSWAVGAVMSQTAPSKEVASTPAPAPVPTPPVRAPVPAPAPTVTGTENDGWGDLDDGDDDLSDNGEEPAPEIEDYFNDSKLHANNAAHNPPSWVLGDATPMAQKLTRDQDEDALFASAFDDHTRISSATKPTTGRLSIPKKPSTGRLVVPTTTNTTSTSFSLAAGGVDKKKPMSLSEKKAEFERRKLERYEKRMKEWEKTRGATPTTTLTSSATGTSRRDDGWTDFSR